MHVAEALDQIIKGRCWDGYEPVPGKEPYSDDSCRKKKKKKVEKGEKPFHGYNKKKHSKTGGLSASYRKKYNRETGSNLKAPVTESKPTGKRKGRKKSFCARMGGVKGPTSKDGKLTPKGAALKRWKCSLQDTVDLIKASGEGSRGGKVIGRTRSGKPIYDSAGHSDHASFDSKDHLDAHRIHRELEERAASGLRRKGQQRADNRVNSPSKKRSADYHDSQASAHMSKIPKDQSLSDLMDKSFATILDDLIKGA